MTKQWVRLIYNGSPAVYAYTGYCRPNIPGRDEEQKKKLMFFYEPEIDAFVLNGNREDYEWLSKLMVAFLDLSGLQRKELLTEARNKKITFLESVNKALRVRRKYKSKLLTGCLK